MPSKWTFEIKPIAALLERYRVGKGWIDPFCGMKSPAQFRNDLNPENKHAQFHLEAADYLVQLGTGVYKSEIKGCLFDPPYSLTQVSRSYQDMGIKFKGKENPTGGFPVVRSLLAKMLPEGGISISFGWNTAGLGKKNGMEILEVLIVAHGGNRNDTLVTVERKLNEP